MSLDAAFDSPESKRRHVRALFATIADRYDLITAVLSYGQDARWKAKLASLANVKTGERALDLAAGTGDIAFAIAARGAKTIGLDITHRMLQLAHLRQGFGGQAHLRQGFRLRQGFVGQAGGRAQSPTRVEFITGDMTSLPFQSASFDLVTTGYGLRNVPDLDLAIDEIARVLKPGGRLLSLDFNRPDNVIVRAAYLGYLAAVGSTLGWILHGDPDTYRYIPASIRRYPGARGVADRLTARGFDRVTVIPLLFGLMSLHLGTWSSEANRPDRLTGQRANRQLTGQQDYNREMADVAVVRKRVRTAVEQARRDQAERRGRVAEAQQNYDLFLDASAIPAFRMIANVLKSEGFHFEVMTPADGVRLQSERNREDAIEMELDTTADPPQPLVTITRVRGSRIVQTDRTIKGSNPLVHLTEDDVIEMLLEELRPWLV